MRTNLSKRRIERLDNLQVEIEADEIRECEEGEMEAYFRKKASE